MEPNKDEVKPDAPKPEEQKPPKAPPKHIDDMTLEEKEAYLCGKMEEIKNRPIR